MIEYRTMTDDVHARDVVEMMHALYGEDPVEASPEPPDALGTVRALLERPEAGRIVLFADGPAVVGYSILIPFRSNEYGGVVVFVDELYVKPAARRRGIGRGFFEALGDERPFGAVALFLEVTPENRRARALYESLGFRRRRNSTLARRLEARAEA